MRPPHALPERRLGALGVDKLNCASLLSLLLFLSLMLPGAASAGTPLVVVFDIEDQARALRPADKKALGEYIAAKLAESGDYRVVPMGRLRKLLRSRKIRRCQEWGCKSSIGWEFKTHKLLATRLMRLGRQCVLTSNMHGLKSAAVERSATAKGGCRQEALTSAVERVVATLTGRGDVEPQQAQQAAGRKADEPGAPGAVSSGAGADEPAEHVEHAGREGRDPSASLLL